MLSLHTGYDTAYLTDAVGNGTAATDYYTAAAGEPPGYWQGAGARALGLAGQVDAEVMRRLYHEDVGPDGQVLVRRQKPGKYPAAGGSLYERIDAAVAAQVAALGRFATPEEIRAIRLSERAKFRNRVPFYDYTFSAPKSVSVLWASLLAAAAEAEAAGDRAEAERLAERAAQVRGAVKRANDRMMAVAEREAAYVRTGHHSATSGEYRDAEGFIVGSFEQSDARDGAPQLHVHNAIANRAQRADGADDKWRALHGQPLFRDRLGFAHAGRPVPGPGAGAARLPDRAPRGRHGARGGRDQRRGGRRVLYPGEGTAGPGARARARLRAGARPRSGQAGVVPDQAAGRS